MSETKYEWRKTCRVPRSINSQDAGEELERIREITGKLKPEDVVANAKSEQSPIHHAFEWDDSEAGEKYRVFQARNLIRAVRVVKESRCDDAPAFVSVVKVKETYYQSAEIAVQNIDEFQSAVELLAKKLEGAKKAIDDLRRMAEERGDKTASLIAIASQALATANSAISQISPN